MFHLMTLPYAENALEPIISQKTLSFHYGAHHRGYVNALNLLTEGGKYAEKSLEEVIKASAEVPEEKKIFNNAAQVWNHDFYWHSLAAKDTQPLSDGPLKQAICRAFGTVDAFYEKFIDNATSQFGSGWCWLVCDKNKEVSILKTGNADLPLLYGKKALLTCDVWEHAYYLDYQNKRADYVRQVITQLWNWTYAEGLFSSEWAI